MKKALKLIIVLIGIFVIGIKGVKAETVNVTQQFVDNVWSFHYRNGGVWTFGNLPFNYANGNLVYCIQPDARITTSTYNVYGDFTMSGYSNDVKRQMELISYYGYKYPGHESLKYYMATQELMWLYSSDESIKWTTGNTDDTPMIDVSYEKNEIQRLISTHNLLPSFSNSVNTLEVGKDFQLVDTNNTLEKYDVVVPSGVNYSINGNKITFNSSNVGTYTISFNAKQNYNGTTYIYDDFSTRTQTLASFGKPDLVNFTITLNVNPLGKININKTDEENNELDGVEFEVYDEKENLVDTLVSEKGKASSKDLSLGKYYVIETKPLYGFEKDENRYEINLVKNDQNINLVEEKLDIVNKKIKCEITYITTSGEENIDAKFNIYDKEGNLVYSGETINGKASIELPYGEYKIKEIEVPNGYKLNEEEISFSVNDITCASTLKVNNEKVIMPVTSAENNIAYLIVALLDLGGFIFVKKNS